MSLFTLIGAGVVVWLIVAIVLAIWLGQVIDRRDQQIPPDGIGMVTVSTRPVNTVPRKDDHQ